VIERVVAERGARPVGSSWTTGRSWRARPSTSGPTSEASTWISSTPESPSRTASSRASTGASATSASTSIGSRPSLTHRTWSKSGGGRAASTSTRKPNLTPVWPSILQPDLSRCASLRVPGEHPQPQRRPRTAIFGSWRSATRCPTFRTLG